MFGLFGSSSKKTFRHKCYACDEGTVSIKMSKNRYPIMLAGARSRKEAAADGRSTMKSKFGDWPGFKIYSGKCGNCGDTWFRGSVKAIPYDRNDSNPTFYKPLRCPSCHHRVSRHPRNYPEEDEVVDKQLGVYSSNEVETAKGDYYTQYMTEGIECRWNNQCDTSRFFVKAKIDP